MTTAADAFDVRLDAIYRAESRRVLATLIRLLGGFQLAEEAVHDAFMVAAERWRRDGVPANPYAWLVSTGRFRAIDRLRRNARFDAVAGELGRRIEAEMNEPPPAPESIADDQLRLIFVCCHPAFPVDAQVAMTLREVCGLTTEDIAHAFMVAPTTVAQRIVRAKAKVRAEMLPYEVPAPEALPSRLEAVLRVIYLVFNEGYLASSGASAMRESLIEEAIRLARLLAQLLPDPECLGLLALMLLHDSRRRARLSPAGDIILFADQDRALWDTTRLAEGRQLAAYALRGPEIGHYAIEAAIAAEHARATEGAVDWPRIVTLYDLLLEAAPSPVVALNRAVAIAMRDGPVAGLALIDDLLGQGELATYQLAHAARADLLRRAGQRSEAAEAYRRALDLSGTEADRRFLERRLAELHAAD